MLYSMNFPPSAISRFLYEETSFHYSRHPVLHLNSFVFSMKKDVLHAGYSLHKCARLC